MTAVGEELVQLAHWADVREVQYFSASVRLQRLSSERFTVDAELRAEVVQDCVVTLEPVRSVLSRTIHRDLHLLTERSRGLAAGDVVVDPASEDDDVQEEIESLRYDLAGPLLEELALALDPYPRAPGVALALPSEPEGGQPNPFAVLKNLKKQG